MFNFHHLKGFPRSFVWLIYTESIYSEGNFKYPSVFQYGRVTNYTIKITFFNKLNIKTLKIQFHQMLQTYKFNTFHMKTAYILKKKERKKKHLKLLHQHNIKSTI